MDRTIALLFSHKFMLSAVVVYQVTTGLIAEYSAIDLMIPCLFKTFFQVECWGCGLSSAAIELLHFRFSLAAQKNPLIYAVMGLVAYYFAKHSLSFADPQ
ncbi:MAG: DUF2752 domain-containing protein [Flavobacteriaceae bacterium]